MILKIDSREQNPLSFKGYDSISSVVTEGLPFGDYWSSYEPHVVPEGCQQEMPIVFERKSVGDLYGTLSSGMERFKREIEKCHKAGFKMYLIVEVPMWKVLAGYEHSTKLPDSIIKTMFTLEVKYGVTPVFCTNRDEMVRYIVETFEAFGRSYKPKKISQSGGTESSAEQAG